MKTCIMIFTGFIYFIFWLIMYVRLFYFEQFYSSIVSMLFWVPLALIIVIMVMIIKKLYQYQELQYKVDFMKQMDQLRKKQKDNIQLSIANDNLKLERNLSQLQIIAQFLRQNEYQKAKENFQSLYEGLKLDKTTYYCHNAYINAVLYHKKSLAEQFGITIIYDIKLPEKDDLDIIDLPTIIFNILDNAIEVNKQNKNGQIYLSMKYNEKYISIYQRNSNSHKEKEDFQGIHGYGLKIIEEIVEKYDGGL